MVVWDSTFTVESSSLVLPIDLRRSFTDRVVLCGFTPDLDVWISSRKLSFVTLSCLSTVSLTPTSTSFDPWDVPLRFTVLIKGRDLPIIPSDSLHWHPVWWKRCLETLGSIFSTVLGVSVNLTVPLDESFIRLHLEDRPVSGSLKHIPRRRRSVPVSTGRGFWKVIWPSASLIFWGFNCQIMSYTPLIFLFSFNWGFNRLLFLSVFTSSWLTLVLHF